MIFFLVIYQLPYNANGDILQPVICHKGEITDLVQKNFEGRMTFVQTKDGCFDYDAILKLLETVDALVEFFF